MRVEIITTKHEYFKIEITYTLPFKTILTDSKNWIKSKCTHLYQIFWLNNRFSPVTLSTQQGMRIKLL